MVLQSMPPRALGDGVKIGALKIIGMLPIILRQQAGSNVLFELLLRARRQLGSAPICQLAIGAIVLDPLFGFAIVCLLRLRRERA